MLTVVTCKHRSDTDSRSVVHVLLFANVRESTNFRTPIPNTRAPLGALLRSLVKDGLINHTAKARPLSPQNGLFTEAARLASVNGPSNSGYAGRRRFSAQRRNTRSRCGETRQRHATVTAPATHTQGPCGDVHRVRHWHVRNRDTVNGKAYDQVVRHKGSWEKWAPVIQDD